MEICWKLIVFFFLFVPSFSLSRYLAIFQIASFIRHEHIRHSFFSFSLPAFSKKNYAKNIFQTVCEMFDSEVISAKPIAMGCVRIFYFVHSVPMWWLSLENLRSSSTQTAQAINRSLQLFVCFFFTILFFISFTFSAFHFIYISHASIHIFMFCIVVDGRNGNFMRNECRKWFLPLLNRNIVEW